MVELGRVSRASFYRFNENTKPDRDMDLRDAIQRIALEWPSYGRPRITAELRRRGWTVNAKRVYRLLLEDNLLCVRKRKFVLTTDSNHGRRVYPNLAADLVLTGVDQLWRADITYIRPRSECDKVILPVENFAANGEQSLNCLSQSRGQPHTVSLHPVWPRPTARFPVPLAAHRP